MNTLKRKKRLETQLAQMDGTLLTIEFQREALENAQNNTEVLKTMSLAAKTLKHAQLWIEKKEALKRKKRLETQLAQMDGMLLINHRISARSLGECPRQCRSVESRAL